VVRELARVTAAGGRWLAIEPNHQQLHVGCTTRSRPGGAFTPGRFLRHAAATGWSLRDRARLFVVPSGIERLPNWATRAERVLERMPVVSGAVLLDLQRAAGGATADGREWPCEAAG
jgi:hypothetical protein